MDMGLDMDIIGFGLGMLKGGGLDMLSGSGPGVSERGGVGVIEEGGVGTCCPPATAFPWSFDHPCYV